MAIIYRSVKGSNLTPTEVDGNFSDLDGRTTILEAQLPALTFDDLDFSVSGSDFYVHIGTATYGPYALPVFSFVDLFRGEWLPSTDYAVNDLFTAPGGLYVVIFAHTSGTTFDPGANDGMGHDYYQALLKNPAIQVTTQTGDTFDPLLADANSYIRFTNSSGCVVTIPDDSEVDFPLFTELHFRQVGTGSIVIENNGTGAAAEVIGEDGFANATAGMGAVCTLKKVAANEWELFGRLQTLTA